jgi:hypothetical protein
LHSSSDVREAVSRTTSDLKGVFHKILAYRPRQ